MVDTDVQKLGFRLLVVLLSALAAFLLSFGNNIGNGLDFNLALRVAGSYALVQLSLKLSSMLRPLLSKLKIE